MDREGLVNGRFKQLGLLVEGVLCEAFDGKIATKSKRRRVLTNIQKAVLRVGVENLLDEIDDGVAAGAEFADDAERRYDR